MISIQPKWVEKILNGEKIIEIRKTMPKCELPIDVYIYCTKDPKHLVAPFHFKKGWAYREYNDNTYYSRGCTANVGEDINGKVVAKFILNKIDEIKLADAFTNYGIVIVNEKMLYNDKDKEKLFDKCCLTVDDITDYLGTCGDFESQNFAKCYGWHIDNLEIFDKPKELSEFYVNNAKGLSCVEIGEKMEDWLRVKKAPQSWQFVDAEQ